MTTTTRYFEISILGDDQDKELCFIESEPEELGGFGYRLAEGDPTDDIFPKGSATIHLDPYATGLGLPDIIGNSIGFLIVSTAVKEILATHEVRPAEIKPLSIFSHKGRLHSRDYWIVNPLRFVDCLNRGASKIQYSAADPSQIVGIDKLVFDGSALGALEKGGDRPDLFRIREQRMGYFLSERLVQALQGNGFTNLFLHEIAVQD